MPNFTVLRPIQPPEKCYLFEVLLWRAFGRYPEEGYVLDDLWRFSDEIRNSYEAPIADGEELSEEECRFAGIPFDPRMEGILSDRANLGTAFHQGMLDRHGDSETFGSDNKSDLERELEDSIQYEAEVAAWMPLYEDYIDQFASEICLDLRRGELTAYATELLDPSLEITENILEERGLWLSDLDVVEVPAVCWVSSKIDWKKSTLLGNAKSFIWILVKVDDMLSCYPPELIIKSNQITPIGSDFAIASSAVGRTLAPISSRGRPSLPWDAFHVQIAKMYRDGEMPQKKEAAIAFLQDWFQMKFGKSVSRAAIGQKLKPYFDELQTKDRK